MFHNENGISIIESLLAITIIFLIAGSLIPQFSVLNEEVVHQKVQMHATEAALNGAKLVRDYQMKNGQFIIDDIEFKWNFVNDSICVSYLYNDKENEQCITKSD